MPSTRLYGNWSSIADMDIETPSQIRRRDSAEVFIPREATPVKRDIELLLSTEEDFLIICDASILNNYGASFPFKRRKDYGYLGGNGSQSHTLKIANNSIWIKDKRVETFKINTPSGQYFIGYPYYAFFDNKKYAKFKNDHLTTLKNSDTMCFIRTEGSGGINIAIIK